MRAYLSAIFCVGICANGFAQSSDDDALAPVFSCIEQYAPDVERSVTDLSDAAIFLAGSVCSVEGAAYQTQQQRLAYAKMQEQQRQRCGSMDATSETYEYVCGEFGEYPDSFLDISASFGYLSAPTEARAHAAKILLNLRIARLEGEQTGE
ncbi:hypothetical protein WNY37_02215 [Henriciella sp. AS95]|uniref:hypothetical protein n=1 Tax=Henriciella sp. AS95 TaxID=3135782 RepID=UPI00316B620E